MTYTRIMNLPAHFMEVAASVGQIATAEAKQVVEFFEVFFKND